MNADLELKLQAYLDGELPAGEVKAVEALLAQDAGARDLLAELTNTRAALTGHEAGIKLPESREFYWSKIQRELQRQEASPAAPVAAEVSVFAWLRRLLVPAGAVATVILAVMLVPPPGGGRSLVTGATETDFAADESFTYRDYASGTTLVWLSYPAENEFAETDSDDTLELN
jgi:anti-sigma factor RsiW